MNRLLRVASGVAVFLVTAFCGTASLFVFLNDRRMQHLRFSAYTELAIIVSVLTVLSFVGTYFLVSDAIKSK